ncbi:MAG: hypothetical protein HZB56_16540 [Deltaproteobacteria bacterium]|nr:hypothetical protein [Deltaproteobacteria bacterium]
MTGPDPLDTILAREPYHPDDGFTERVLASLPPRRRDRRPLVLALSWLAAGAVAAWTLPGLLGPVLRAGLAGLAAPASGTTPALLLAAVLAVGALAYAASRLLDDGA